MENKLYTSAEAARLLGISDGTVRSWLSRYPEVFLVGIHLIEEAIKFISILHTQNDY